MMAPNKLSLISFPNLVHSVQDKSYIIHRVFGIRWSAWAIVMVCINSNCLPFKCSVQSIVVGNKPNKQSEHLETQSKYPVFPYRKCRGCFQRHRSLMTISQHQSECASNSNLCRMSDTWLLSILEKAIKSTIGTKGSGRSWCGVVFG